MKEPGANFGIKAKLVFILACVLVIGILIWSGGPGPLEFEGSDPGPATDYYNLLVQGFRAGQLNVNRDPPPGLAAVPNPYDPRANTPRFWDQSHLSFDMSYYKGKLYLYFGITPALTLFWPFVIVTGHYLSHRNACVIFSILGFIAAAGILYRIWRRYFPEISPWVAASGALGLGLAGGLLEILSSCEVYEVAITCAFAFTMIAMAALWRALHQKERQVRWLGLASLAYGLAIGSRPSLLFGSLFLLTPLAAAASRHSERISRGQAVLLFAAAVVPLMLVGLGLMLYNLLRFGSPFEFGWHYQLTGFDNYSAQQFSLRYLWFNFHFYFLEPVRWTGHLHFSGLDEVPPPGHATIVPMPYSGILRYSPFAWLALAAPLAWKGRLAEGILLRAFTAGAFLLFVICAATLCLFVTASSRYEMDFSPVLLLLAVIGVLGLERAVARLAVWRAVARAFWCLLLAYSLLLNILAAIEAHAANDYFIGNLLFNHGRLDQTIEYFAKASRLEPRSAGFHFALASALSHAGRIDQAVTEFKSALDFQPDFPEAENNLAFTLLRAGRVDEAIHYFQKALELHESYQTLYNLAYAFRLNRKAQEAEASLQKAIELQPQFLPAQIDLSWTLATWPDATGRNSARALAIAQNLNQHHPDDPNVLRTLAAACAETGHFPEALTTAKRALAIAQSQSEMTLVKKLQSEIALYQNNTPCRSFNN